MFIVYHFSTFGYSSILKIVNGGGIKSRNIISSEYVITNVVSQEYLIQEELRMALVEEENLQLEEENIVAEANSSTDKDTRGKKCCCWKNQECSSWRMKIIIRGYCV